MEAKSFCFPSNFWTIACVFSFPSLHIALVNANAIAIAMANAVNANAKKNWIHITFLAIAKTTGFSGRGQGKKLF